MEGLNHMWGKGSWERKAKQMRKEMRKKKGCVKECTENRGKRKENGEGDMGNKKAEKRKESTRIM